MDTLTIITGTNLHTDSERAQFRAELLQESLARLRTAELKKIPQMLQGIRTRRDEIGNAIDTLAAIEHTPEMLADAQRRYDMLDEAAAIFADEILMFVRELRAELADTLTAKYGPEIAEHFAQTLRSGEV